jgi:glycosyltransferase involved in cell wall biosynthesis
MKISYINGVCVRNDAISNAILDEIRFFNENGVDDLRLYANACDYAEVPFTNVDRCADVVLSPHFQASDLVVFHFGIFSPLFNLLPVVPAKAKKIVVFHNITPKSLVAEKDRWLIEKSFAQLDNIRWADHVICDSSTNLAVLLEHGLNAEATVVPLAVHSDLVAPPSKPSFHDDVLRIAFVGRFSRAKGPEQLLRAIEITLGRSGHLGYRRTKVDLIGNLTFSDQALVAELRQKIEFLKMKFGVALEIAIHGSASDDIKHTLLQQADIFILPTSHEGFCVPIIEAIAGGCRVIAYENSNTPAICGGLGLLVQTANVEALSHALASLSTQLRSFAWRSGQGTSSYAHYLKLGRSHVHQFSPKIVAKKFLTVVNKLMGPGICPTRHGHVTAAEKGVRPGSSYRNRSQLTNRSTNLRDQART